MKKFLVAFLLSTLACYAGVENLRRTIVLDNGLTFDITPDYHNERLCVELTVSHGFARLNDDENYYIEFANNLERLMEDAGYDFKEAFESVTIENGISGHDVNIIIDESCIDRIDIEAMINVVGADHVFRK